MKSIRGTAITFIVLSIIIYIVLMIILLIILCIANRPPAGLSRGLRIFAQFIIIVQIIFSILVLILGIGLIFAGVYIFYGCEVIDGIINNRDYIRNNLTKAHAKYPALNTLANECVFRNGSGFLINALSSNGNVIFDQAFQQLDFSSSGTQQINALNINNQPAPPIGSSIRQQITDHITYTNVPRDDPSAQDITQATVSFNARGCRQDILAVRDCPVGFQASTGSDAPNTAIGANYCIRYPSKPNSYSGRYNG